MEYIQNAYNAYYEDEAHVLLQGEPSIMNFSGWLLASAYRWYSPEGFRKWVDHVKAHLEK